MNDYIEEIKQRLEAANGDDSTLLEEPDADLIAHAPADLAHLIGEVERLRQGIREAEGVIHSGTGSSFFRNKARAWLDRYGGESSDG